MNVALRGSSPSTMAAGILLLSKSRSFGQRMHVVIVGDPTDIGVVTGPAILHSAPVASCGVGRDLGNGALVVVPGPLEVPLAVSLSPDGRRDWFYVDRTGEGYHPATRAFVRLTRARGGVARRLGGQMLDVLDVLGCAGEPAVLDLLFGAPAPPLTRIALAMRAGRALAGVRGEPINRFLAEIDEEQEGEGVLSLEAALARLNPTVRDPVRTFFAELSEGSAGLDLAPLAVAVQELVVHFAMLPRQVMLPPLDPAMDAVAFGLGRALAATVGNPQAQTGLKETYSFLGGKFAPAAEYPVDLPADLPPADRLARWQWFCSHVSEAAVRVEKIWRDLVDPPM